MHNIIQKCMDTRKHPLTRFHSLAHRNWWIVSSVWWSPCVRHGLPCAGLQRMCLWSSKVPRHRRRYGHSGSLEASAHVPSSVLCGPAWVPDPTALHRLRSLPVPCTHTFADSGVAASTAQWSPAQPWRWRRRDVGAPPIQPSSSRYIRQWELTPDASHDHQHEPRRNTTSDLLSRKTTHASTSDRCRIVGPHRKQSE